MFGISPRLGRAIRRGRGPVPATRCTGSVPGRSRRSWPPPNISGKHRAGRQLSGDVETRQHALRARRTCAPSATGGRPGAPPGRGAVCRLTALHRCETARRVHGRVRRSRDILDDARLVVDVHDRHQLRVVTRACVASGRRDPARRQPMAPARLPRSLPARAPEAVQ